MATSGANTQVVYVALLDLLGIGSRRKYAASGESFGMDTFRKGNCYRTMATASHSEHNKIKE